MIYVDTNALIYVLHGVKPEGEIALEYIEAYDEVFTSIRAIEETAFVLIRLTMERVYAVKGSASLKKALKKYDLSPVKEELEALRNFIKEGGIRMLPDVATLEEMEEVILNYKLLPGDAIIALTCKHYGIRRILTFDEDFKRVPWLEVLP